MSTRERHRRIGRPPRPEEIPRSQAAIVGANIRALRLRHGLTQAQLGALMGWPTTTTVCAAEGRRGDRQRGFTEAEVAQLARIFNTTPARLSTRCAHCDGHPPPGYSCLTCSAAEQTRQDEEASHVKSDKPSEHHAASAGERPLTYTPWASEHDLIYGYAYAILLNGQGAEPWLVRPLVAWTIIAEEELERRELLKKAEHAYRALLEHYHENHPHPLQP